MSAAGTTVAGGGAPHNNMPPYLTLNFIIALQGVYPARS
jgi:microcystin-dependent protein